ncbi:MAG: hypothetical protein ACRDJU_12155 [Actinomycetota bacterium]
MQVKAGHDVVFDFEGALALARRLYALADQLASVGATRQRGAEGASVGFVGSYAQAFSGRLATEAANVSAVAAGLRGDAGTLAAMWKTEMDNENRVRYARHVDALKSARSEVSQIEDWLTGTFHYPPEPAGVALPQPPAFAPTAELVAYPAPARAVAVPHPVR